MPRTDYRIFPWLKHMQGKHDQHTHAGGSSKPVTDEDFEQFPRIPPEGLGGVRSALEDKAAAEGRTIYALAYNEFRYKDEPHMGYEPIFPFSSSRGWINCSLPLQDMILKRVVLILPGKSK